MKIRTLLTDLGGVLLTNGWGTSARVQAAKQFDLDYKVMDDRHRLTFDTYELGKMTLDQYLDEIVFYEKRSFSREDFKKYMYSCSKPYDDMLQLMKELKKSYPIKIGVISNEGSGITHYRLSHFGLDDFVDFYIVSCFVHLKKPDPDIYRLALDVANSRPEETLYLDDRPLLVEAGKRMGMNAIQHENLGKTKELLVKALEG